MTDPAFFCPPGFHKIEKGVFSTPFAQWGVVAREVGVSAVELWPDAEHKAAA